ncbi:hypothetical protein TSOC_013984 [Tetrabaena socialis]|uniref:Uncharacterized protein n=1 Tax=Tetrabaena socialis TaxID=47790 RepID=A0A2J7ZIW7_9CHLO|nr:hypothetical protein TSOC_013984 [Tetrabaena socialis]|eukprot:PNH00209.1 hypothetical protein TSOC_013984 [Tetrabaena socialis]
MIEDCMNLLLDLDDIDRLATHMAAMAQAQQRAAAVAAALPGQQGGGMAAAAAAAGGSAVAPYGPAFAAPPAQPALRERRALLLAGVNGAFRLPGRPAGADGGGADGMEVDGGAAAAPLGDGVLLRILALSKGRGVVARALLAILPPASLAARPSPAAPAPAPAPAAAPAPQQPEQGQHAAGAEGGAAAMEASPDTPGAPAAAATPSSAPGATAAAPAVPAAASAVGEGDAGGPSPYVLLWATLRNAWPLFGSSLQQHGGGDGAAERQLQEATARLGAGLREARLELPAAGAVLAAAAAVSVEPGGGGSACGGATSGTG